MQGPSRCGAYCVHMCACVCVKMRVCACVCTCVRERVCACPGCELTADVCPRALTSQLDESSMRAMLRTIKIDGRRIHVSEIVRACLSEPTP
jgi:hypothetical protein